MFTALGSFFNRISDPEMGEADSSHTSNLGCLALHDHDLFALLLSIVLPFYRGPVCYSHSARLVIMELNLELNMTRHTTGGAYLTLLNTIANMGKSFAKSSFWLEALVHLHWAETPHT